MRLAVDDAIDVAPQPISRFMAHPGGAMERQTSLPFNSQDNLQYTGAWDRLPAESREQLVCLLSSMIAEAARMPSALNCSDGVSERQVAPEHDRKTQGREPHTEAAEARLNRSALMQPNLHTRSPGPSDDSAATKLAQRHR
jgi:hypothetical protein